jgi:hypothetical protein
MRFEECMRTSFPSSAPSGHPLSPVRRREGRKPVPDSGPNQDLRSDAVPRRMTPSRRPGCLSPLRPRQASVRRIAPPNESCASVPRSRRPHFFPELGRVPSRALQAPECGHPRSLAFEVQAPLLPMGSILSNLSCLGLTTQARPSARPSWLVCESCLLCSYPRRSCHSRSKEAQGPSPKPPTATTNLERAGQPRNSMCPDQDSVPTSAPP